MPASTALRSAIDIESFMTEYYEAWGGTDEDRMQVGREELTTAFSNLILVRRGHA